MVCSFGLGYMVDCKQKNYDEKATQIQSHDQYGSVGNERLRAKRGQVIYNSKNIMKT